MIKVEFGWSGAVVRMNVGCARNALSFCANGLQWAPEFLETGGYESGGDIDRGGFCG